MVGMILKKNMNALLIPNTGASILEFTNGPNTKSAPLLEKSNILVIKYPNCPKID